MKISELLSLSFIVVFAFLLVFSLFLNYISVIYSDVNLFKVDLTKKKRKKLIFVLKNGNLLFTVICVYQVFLNIIMSDIFMKGIGKPILKELNKSNYR